MAGNSHAARDSSASQAARKRLEEYVQRSEAQQNTVLTQLMKSVIVDKLVPPGSMHFQTFTPPGANLPSVAERDLKLRVGLDEYTIHQHALGQMADVCGLTRAYQTKLKDSGQLWKLALLEHNLQTLFRNGEFRDRRGNQKRFLVRVVDKQIRGFLSQNYNRKLMTAPLLRTFIEHCRSHHAGPVETSATDVRVRVKYMLPIVFEPVDGEYVSFGVTFSNSDFGAARLSVSSAVMRIGSGTTAVLSDKFSRTHLGSIIQDSDLEMSEETAAKELEAVSSVIKDKIEQTLGEESIERGLKAIQVAHELKIPWYQVKNKLGDLLTKAEMNMMEVLLRDESSAITNLPPVQKTEGEAGATAWWLSNVVSHIANTEKDPDRKADLQEAAGRLISE